jgi:hypothetical protein
MIIQTHIVANSDVNLFHNQVEERIKEIQSKNLKVEIQYSTCVLKKIRNGNISEHINYSAFIIGRK